MALENTIIAYLEGIERGGMSRIFFFDCDMDRRAFTMGRFVDGIETVLEELHKDGQKGFFHRAISEQFRVVMDELIRVVGVHRGF